MPAATTRRRIHQGVATALLSACICPVPVAVTAASDEGITCHPWRARTIARLERLPEQKWRDAIISSLGDAPCASLPTELRRAARAIRLRSNTTRADRLLADAASAILGPSCRVPDPASDAVALAPACPLPLGLGFRLSDIELGDIRAVDYVLLNAMASSLQAAKEYDESGQRLMMDFTLSAGLRGERAKQAKREKAHRP
jgi:hypothetical protein